MVSEKEQYRSKVRSMLRIAFKNKGTRTRGWERYLWQNWKRVDRGDGGGSPAELRIAPFAAEATDDVKHAGWYMHPDFQRSGLS